MTGEPVLNRFDVPSGGTYYDGTGHSLGRLACTLTNSHFIIKEDMQGRTYQIMLSEITSIEPHPGFMNKYLDVKMGSFKTMRIYVKSRNELAEIAGMISDALASQFT